jgi:toxin-antitoxin system PIN domain toxin
LDTNTWIALALETHPQHAIARAWYQAAPLRGGDLLFCRATEQSFLRLVTQEQVMKRCGVVAMTNEQAIEYLAAVYADPAVALVDEPPAARSLWFELANSPHASPNLWMDAYLAAFAIALGAEMVTFDRGFTRFAQRGLALRLL